MCKAWKAYFLKGGATSVVEEPKLLPPPAHVAVRPATTQKPDARADLAVTGLSETHHFEFFDVAIIDTGSDSRVSQSSAKVLEQDEQKKRSEYEDRLKAHGHHFVPLVCSVYGTLAPDAIRTATRVARRVDACGAASSGVSARRCAT